MRTMNCGNIRREIEEAGPGDVLSSEVDQHLAHCTTCKTLARQQANLHKIVSSLGTVEAPGDFDFRLRARLAADKRQPRPFALAGLSFGVRSASMAALMLVLFGAAVLFVVLRTRPDNSAPEVVAGGAPNANQANPTVVGTVPVPATAPERVNQPEVVATAEVAGSESSAPPRVRRRGANMTTLASYRDSRTSYGGTRDSSGTGAVVLNSNQGSAFPIDASYQSLKVSIDDGRGSSRTISLPTVSFGSQRALSQDASPLMASARGSW
jgi:hypothetical protein